jgi:hypothetical protein
MKCAAAQSQIHGRTDLELKFPSSSPTAEGLVEAKGALTDTPSEVLRSVTIKARALLDVERVMAGALESKTGLLRGQVSAARGDTINDYVARVRPGGFVDEILKTRAAVLIHDVRTDPRIPAALAQKWGIRSVLGVPMIIDDAVIGLLTFDNGLVPYQFDARQQHKAMTIADLAGVMLASANRRIELGARLAAVESQNRALRQAQLIEERLASVAAEGASVSSLAQIISDMTNKPCSVHDAQGRRIATGERQSSVRSISVTVPVDIEFWKHPQIVRQLKAAQSTGPTIVGPIPSIGMHHRHMLIPSSARNRIHGYVILMEVGSRFTALDSLVVQRCATIAASGLAPRRTTSAPRGPVIQLQTRDERRQRSSGAMSTRISCKHGLATNEGSYAVVTIAAVGSKFFPDLAALSRACAKANLGRPTVCETDCDRVVVLTVQIDASRPRPEAIESVKRQVLTVLNDSGLPVGLVAGVSAACQGTDDFRRGLQEASETMRCLTVFATNTRSSDVLTADELGPCRLLLTSADRADAERFAEERLGPLLNGGSDKYLATVKAFFDCSRSVRQTSVALGLHENTIRYRLARVAEITGLDVLSNSEDQLAAQVSLSVLRLVMRLS